MAQIEAAATQTALVEPLDLPPDWQDWDRSELKFFIQEQVEDHGMTELHPETRRELDSLLEAAKEEHDE